MDRSVIRGILQPEEQWSYQSTELTHSLSNTHVENLFMFEITLLKYRSQEWGGGSVG